MSGASKMKPYEELEFTDDFIFSKILQNNPELCKELTELILGRKIAGIVQVQQQKPIEITANGRGVRFDVYMTDANDIIYDIEMQTAKFKSLPKRSRYYQGMIDLNVLERGAKYSELRSCYIIFICVENPFPKVGLHKYTFVNTCREKNDLELNDESVKIFLSADGTADDISEEMKAFLSYLKNHVCSSDFTKRIEAEVDNARKHTRWRMEYMTLYEHEQIAREEGRNEGLRDGICGTARFALETGMPLKEIIDKISVIYNITNEKAEEYVRSVRSATSETLPYEPKEY